ncbi:MAG: hypothetical protein ABW096_02500 [Candidatus Thiodiazotropha sp.]
MIKYSNIGHKYFTLIFMLIVITGCGGGGGGGSSSDITDDGSSDILSGNPDTNNGTEDGVNNGAAVDYDLAAYLFDASLRQVGGFVSYESHMHNIHTGQEVMADFENSEQWETTADDTIVFSVNNSTEPKITYVIHDAIIEDIKNDPESEPVTITRFASIGETYVDEQLALLSADTHFSCQILDHLDSFDFNTVTSELTENLYYNFDMGTFTMDMADGVYLDVLHVRCIMTLNQAPINDMESFYAKGIGHILSVDKLGIFLGGPCIIIPERSGTVYYGTGI